jgi:prepilin signal peptidase PulO-like enzyme (type II secretory pathway)
MEVHTTVSFILMIVLVILNITLFLLNGSDSEILILERWGYTPYSNMLGTLALGSIFQLVVLISKEKALGQGDVRIAIITGILIGITNLVYWLYITIFSALIYGLILAYRKKKFKGLKIPFVPFMVLGIIVLILWYI